jgi:hypothetical protein
MTLVAQRQFSESLTFAGAPTNGVNDQQTITITGSPTGGSFTLTFGGQTTSALPWNATAAQVQAALNALSSIGGFSDLAMAGSVVCTGGPLPGTGIVVTFAGALAGESQSVITHTDSLTGGSSPVVVITHTTSGVTATWRGVGKGNILLDTTHQLIYMNTGTAHTPVWTAWSDQDG